MRFQEMQWARSLNLHLRVYSRKESGVHPKVVQSIMRHKDINLTMSLYTHTLRGQESEAISKLPDLSQASERASGTDG